jgi:hypothetical protein
VNTTPSFDLDALGFNGSAYPLSATLSGKATLQITRASDGVSLSSQGNLPFTAKAYDSGNSSGIGYDRLILTLSGSSVIGLKSFTDVTLKGGNVVIHLK